MHEPEKQTPEANGPITPEVASAGKPEAIVMRWEGYRGEVLNDILDP